MEARKFMGEKLRETFHVLENVGGEAVARFNGIFPPETRPEKFKRLRLAAANSGAAGLAWLLKVSPPEKKAEKISYHWLDITKPYLTAAAAVAVLVMLCRFFCLGHGGRPARLMKSPGRNHRMAKAEREREMGLEEVMQFVVEKLKEALLAVENFGGEALGWFDDVLPPETRTRSGPGLTLRCRGSSPPWL